MKGSLIILALICGAVETNVYATTRQLYQPATVVSVTRRDIRSNYIGSPTDAPLQSDVHSYDVGIQLNCTVYVVRYESGLDYLPSVFAPHQTVEVNLEKHVMDVNLSGAREARLSILSRSRVKDASCASNN